MQADGTRMSGGTSYESAYGDFNLADGATLDLSNSSRCNYYNEHNSASGSTGDSKVCGGIQTFYVPKDASQTAASYLTNAADYYRFQILADKRIIRAEWDKDSSQGGGSATTDGNNCFRKGGYGWRNCIEATPTYSLTSNGLTSQFNRTPEQERTNYAIWYSYHRTRMKTAKAGAAEAFNAVGNNVRVGFRTIWGRNVSNPSSNTPTQAIPIPVTSNNGLFEDSGQFDNRSKWYARLFGAISYDGTPLHSALDLAGQYYSSDSSSGAYGPESGTSQYQCRQNFTILTTDGYWNSRAYRGGGSGSVSVGEQDAANGETYTSATGGSLRYTPSLPYSSSYSNTLADVAMKYWKTDLRTTLANVVPTTAADPAFWQHMVTFGISIGANGELDPATDLPALTNGSKQWPDPQMGNTDGAIEIPARLDDLWHAAINGHGDFVVANNPTAFSKGLNSALSAITERIGSFASVAATSTSVTSSTQMFSARYTSRVWTGQLLACPSTAASCEPETATWKATDKIPVPTSRRIYTMAANGGGAAFPAQFQTTALGADVTDYLRGVQSKELQNGGGLRNRATVLGDIVDSTPTYVSATNTVYLGANDGMLHAFNASTGAEVFAYVPRGVSLDDLASLARTDYAHRYFVDGPVVVSTQAQTPGQNILAGTLGRGGKGLYTLDVSNPGTFGASNVKWEATETSGGNMGKILSKPFIARLNNGMTALVTGNGVNSSTGHAVLLVYNLANGDLIRELDTGSGGATAATTNGLFAPTGWDSDGNGTIEAVYAGDLQGHVWKFNLGSADKDSWSVANAGSALFTASNDGGGAQAITSGIVLARNPTTQATWMFFGTGRYLVATDTVDKSVQTMYGVIDSGVTVQRTALTKRSILVSTSSSGYAVRGFQANAALPASSKGWYINLLVGTTAEGERIVSTPQIQGSTLVATSIIPTQAGCQSDGAGWVYALDAFTGTSTGTPYFDLNGNGNTNDDTINSDGTSIPVGGVSLGVGMLSAPMLYNGQLTAGGSKGTTATINTGKIKGARTSWREVLLDN
jgi:type IV pilus assembly protein PilY1